MYQVKGGEIFDLPEVLIFGSQRHEKPAHFNFFPLPGDYIPKAAPERFPRKSAPCKAAVKNCRFLYPEKHITVYVT